MILKQIRVEASKDITTNSYIISNENESMVIDPGGEPNKIIEILEAIKTKPKYILLTHCHADHIGGVKDIKEKYNSKVLISRIDSTGVNEQGRNLASFIGIGIPEVEVDSRLDDGDLIHVGNLEFKILSTPGHTNGGISVYCEQEKLLFSGDTLFAGACRKNRFTNK